MCLKLLFKLRVPEVGPFMLLGQSISTHLTIIHPKRVYPNRLA